MGNYKGNYRKYVIFTSMYNILHEDRNKKDVIALIGGQQRGFLLDYRDIYLIFYIVLNVDKFFSK